MKRLYLKNRQIFFVIFMLVIMIFSQMLCGGGFAISYAATAQQEELFDGTDIMDDLAGMTIDGKAFDLSDYSLDDDRSVEVLNFAEYCYAKDSSRSGNYALYVYFYHPQGDRLKKDSALNKIQFRAGNDENFGKYYLKYLSSYRDMLYKYKVVLTSKMRQEILSRLDEDNRIYEVSGIELLNEDETNSTEYYVATQYSYTGYSAGYGSDTSTLCCTSKETDVVTLDVQGTYYRYPKTIESVLEYSVISTQLNSVYFAVDNKYLQKFGTIYKIWAEYWQYQLAPIVVTKNDDVYNFLQNAPADLSNVGEDTAYLLDGYSSRSSNSTVHSSWRYGKGSSYPIAGTGADKSSDYVEYTKKVLSFKADDPRNAVISRDDLKSEMYALAESTGAENGRLNEYVLTGGNGYTKIDLAADDLFDLKGFNAGSDIANWWHGLWGYNNADIESIGPIYEVNAVDLVGTDKDISNNLLIAQSDVAAFKTYCADEMAKDKTIFLFRYGQSEYQEMPVLVSPTGITSVFSQLDNQSLRFQTVDMNFDIIQLGFGNANQLVVIPVVASPIDVIANSEGIIKNPLLKNDIPWWVYLIIAIVVLVLIIVFAPQIITWIFKILVSIFTGLISLPGKMIQKLKDRKSGDDDQEKKKSGRKYDETKDKKSAGRRTKDRGDRGE